MKLVTAVPILLLLTAACASVRINAEEEAAGAGATATAEDFAVLEGEAWTGELEYLNYGREDRSTIPVGAKISVLSETRIEYALQYPGEESHNAKEVFELSSDGRAIDGATIVGREKSGGALVLTTRGEGTDDNRPALIEMVYRISPNEFRVQKNVRFPDADAYFNRNEYRFRR